LETGISKHQLIHKTLAADKKAQLIVYTLVNAQFSTIKEHLYAVASYEMAIKKYWWPLTFKCLTKEVSPLRIRRD